MTGTRLLRRVAARTLSGMSVALSVAAKANEVGARLLDPDREPAPSRPPESAGEPTAAPAASRIEDLFSEAAEDVTEVTDRVSDTLREQQPAPARPPEAAPAVAREPEAPAEPEPAPPPPPADIDVVDQDHLRSAESHVAALADMTVVAIQARIPHLSTEELEALYSYEQAHRNRKTVLAAIERSLAPDVERVYSTETDES